MSYNTIIVSEFSGDNYLINNDIYISFKVDFGSITPIRIGYYSLSIERVSDGYTETFKPFAFDPTMPVRLNIAPIIKSMFKDPSTDNSYLSNTITQDNIESFTFRFVASWYFDNGGDEEEERTPVLSITKRFIRGGNIEGATNLTKSVNNPLSPVKILPYWDGYPVAKYTLRSLGIEKDPVLSNMLFKEKLLEIGCNSVYLKFLNRNGGFSYWLFESETKNKQGQNIGLINNPYHVLDLGNKSNYNFQLYSKVPERFYPLMEDLIISPYIFRFDKLNNSWTQIQNDNNTLNVTINKKIYEVKLKFKPLNHFNGSVLWQ